MSCIYGCYEGGSPYKAHSCPIHGDEAEAAQQQIGGLHNCVEALSDVAEEHEDRIAKLEALVKKLSEQVFRLEIKNRRIN